MIFVFETDKPNGLGTTAERLIVIKVQGAHTQQECRGPLEGVMWAHLVRFLALLHVECEEYSLNPSVVRDVLGMHRVYVVLRVPCILDLLMSGLCLFPWHVWRETVLVSALN